MNAHQDGKFGVWFVKGKEWALHQRYHDLGQAKREARYLVEMLGLRAQVFVKL